MMKFIHFVSIIGIIFSGTKVLGQTTTSMDLRSCVQFALENNLQFKQANMSIQQSQLNKKQAEWAITPNANASLRHGANFGRSIDFTSYQYVTQATHSSQFSINLGQPVYMGMQMRNRIQQSKIDLESSQKDADVIRDNISLSVAQAYLTVVLGEEQIEVLKKQLEQTQTQLRQTELLIEAGNLPENNRLDLEAQLARSEQALQNAENSLVIAYMNLKVLMNFEAEKPLKITRFDVKIPEDRSIPEFQVVFQNANNFMPAISSALLKEQSADYNIKIARGALQPTVTAYGSIFTNFSSAARETSYQTVNQTFNLQINGNSVPVEFPTTAPVQGAITPYFKQIWENLYGNIGVSANVPIFNGLQTRIAIQRAELGLQMARLNTAQASNQLKMDIQRSINDVKAAEKTYQVAEKTLNSTRLASENTKRRYELGVVNAFELSAAQTLLINAESSLLQAKYDLIFKWKVLDFYLGKKLN